MKINIGLILFFLVITSLTVSAQNSAPADENTFNQAAQSFQQRLEASVAELNRLREQTVEEKVPLSRKLNNLENELTKIRAEYQQTARMLDSRTLDLNNLRTDIKTRKEESLYLSNLLSEYIRNFESRLHISEIDRYEDALEKAKLAAENSSLSEHEVHETQAGILTVSLERLNDALGGTRFEGTAVDSNGIVKPGAFVLVGPAALFQSKDGEAIGTAEQRLGSLEPAVIPFSVPEDTGAAQEFMSNTGGAFLLDPTLGTAHKIEETQESLIDHIKKGGVVMYPIFTLAGAALLVAIIKWLGMIFTRKPSQKRIRALLNAVAERNKKIAIEKAKAIKGPVGKMLQAGVDYLEEPRELVEEVMYEKMLSTRLKLERFLPFIAISAASAPLLGLLGTVTGIKKTRLN